jgi:hypothetical protein
MCYLDTATDFLIFQQGEVRMTSDSFEDFDNVPFLLFFPLVT